MKQILKKVNPGFTIVELLVVIVVIAILAAITFMSYVTISQNAVAASLQAKLSDVSKELSVFQIINDNYPVTIDCTIPDNTTNMCLKVDNDMTLAYIVNNIDSARFFCIAVSKNSLTYRIGNDGVVAKGDCLSYGLILHLDSGDRASYPGTGSTLFDLSGSNNGTLTNGVTYTNSNHGFMNFDGINDYIAVSPIEFKTTQPWSFSLGMVIPSGLNSGWQNTVSNSSDTDSTWLFHGGTQLTFYQDYYSNYTWIWYTGVFIGTQIPKDTFFVMTVTCEPVSLYKTNFKVYINGVLKAQQIFSWSNRLAAPRQIISNIGGSNGDRFFQGKIQDIRVYNRVLGTEEAVNIYNILNNRYAM